MKFLSSIYSGQPAGRLCQSLWITTTVCNNNKKMISSLLSATGALIFWLEHILSSLWFFFWAYKLFLGYIIFLFWFLLSSELFCNICWFSEVETSGGSISAATVHFHSYKCKESICFLSACPVARVAWLRFQYQNCSLRQRAIVCLFITILQKGFWQAICRRSNLQIALSVVQILDISNLI